MGDENEETDVPENDPDAKKQALLEKIGNDLVELEAELETHGSSVRQLLAVLAKHTLGMTVAGVAVKPLG